MAAFLIVAGGVAQIVGVALVAIEYREARKRVEAYVHRTRTIFAKAIQSTARMGTPTLTGDVSLGPPSPLERIVELERRANAFDSAIAQARQEMEDRDDKLEARVAERIDSAIETTRKSIMGDVGSLAELVVGLNDDCGHRRRVASVVALVGGLVLATLGGVLAL